MRKIAILALLGFALQAAPAHADLDQRCLGTCKQDGHPTNVCLQQCTYNMQDKPPPALGLSDPDARIPVPPPKPAPSGHNVFIAPVPSDDLVISTVKPPPEASKDYRCVTSCMKDGGQYKLCNDRCTRIDCTPGSPQCSDLRGVVPDSVLTTPNMPAQAPISSAVMAPSKGYMQQRFGP